MRIVQVIGVFFLSNAVIGAALASDYGQSTYGSSSAADAASSGPVRIPDTSTASSTSKASPTMHDASRPPSSRPIVNVPRRGETMKAVRAARGAPRSTRGPVGQPPITRWNYDGYHVYFEHNRVIHTVVPSDPEPLYYVGRLEKSH